MDVLDDADDPLARRVVLDADGWNHIITQHAELEPHQDAIMGTVRRPDLRTPDPRLPGRERYWRRAAGPSRWLLVVIDFGQQPARIVTAFGNRKDPPERMPER